MTQHRGYFACNSSGISAYWVISKDTTTKGLEPSIFCFEVRHLIHYATQSFSLSLFCLCLCLVVRWTACPKCWHEKGEQKIPNCHVIKHSLVRYLDTEILPTEIPNDFPIIQMSLVDQNIT